MESERLCELDDMESFDPDKEISLETANFIILSLYREFSKTILSDAASEDEKSFCRKQMNVLRKDMLMIEKDQIINKAKTYYGPLLKKIMEN